MNELFASPFLILGLFLGSFLLSFFLKNRIGRALFGIYSPVACFLLFFQSQDGALRGAFVTYLLLVSLCYAWIRFSPQTCVAFVSLLLISTLVFMRVAPQLWTFADYAVFLGSWAPPLLGRSGLLSGGALVGFSYVCFRLILSAIEFRRDPTSRPDFLSFLGFAFFLPHFIVGPITPFSYFHESFTKCRERDLSSFFRAGLRMILGFTKFYFLSGLFYQLTLTRTLIEIESLAWSHFLVSIFSYTLYIYLNFSGFCDVMIGAAYFAGIRSKENFDSPLLATSLRDFWKRWHISLTDFLQITVFNPLLKLILRQNLPLFLAASVGTFAVFLLMGLWHGFAWNYLVFGLLHASGLVLTSLWPRTWRVPSFAGWALTLSFVTICLFFFENSWERVTKILAVLF